MIEDASPQALDDPLEGRALRDEGDDLAFGEDGAGAGNGDGLFFGSILTNKSRPDAGGVWRRESVIENRNA